MKVTDEMIIAYQKASHGVWPLGVPGGAVERGLQAVLDLIDPVPEGVDRIVDRTNRVWTRHAFDPQLWHLQGETIPVVRSISTIIETRGPIIWNGAA